MSAALPDLAPEIVLRGYFHAKDENRLHMLERVFDPGAELVVVNNASSISFPARTVGREAIIDVLVRNFAQTRIAPRNKLLAPVLHHLSAYASGV